jgi:hypothetical protein
VEQVVAALVLLAQEQPLQVVQTQAAAVAEQAE